jgi:uncharacterized protein (TIGR02391 family)
VQLHDSHTTQPLYKGADLLQSPKIIYESEKLDPDSMKKIILEELDSMRHVLMFGDRTLGNSNINVDWSLIHPDIIKISKKLFEDGHHAHSVESAFKEVNSKIKDFCKQKTGEELDGVVLMRNVFSPTESPLIALDDDLTTKSGKDVQEGYAHIFAGSMQGIRNPPAHANLKISGEKAIHLLFLASLLMFMIDDKLK